MSVAYYDGDDVTRLPAAGGIFLTATFVASMGPCNGLTRAA